MIFNWYDNGTIQPYHSDFAEGASQIHRPGKTQDGGDDQSRKLNARLAKRQQEASKAYADVGSTSEEIQPALLAEQIMSQPAYTVRTDSSLSAAYDFLQKHQIKHAPVLNIEGRLAGILSDRDLLRATSSLTQSGSQQSFIPRRVQDIMTHPVLTAKPQTEIRLLARMLFHENIGAVPILDEDGTLQGILTRNDVLHVVMQNPKLKLWI